MTQLSDVISDSTNCYPFYNVTNDDFETLSSVNRLSQSDIDRLSQSRFIHFEPNQNTALSDNNVELDSSFNTNKIQCDYFLPEDFKKRIENEGIDEKFALLHLNIRSISNKFDSLNNLIEALKIPFQVIGLNETWLNENNLNCFSMNNYEYFGTNRVDKRGGGVGLYVSKQLECKIWNDLTTNIEDIIETKFIEIVTVKTSLLVLFIDHLIGILQHLKAL